MSMSVHKWFVCHLVVNDIIGVHKHVPLCYVCVCVLAVFSMQLPFNPIILMILGDK